MPTEQSKELTRPFVESMLAHRSLDDPRGLRYDNLPALVFIYPNACDAS